MEWIQFIQVAPTLLEPLPIVIQGVVATKDDQDTWKHALILQCCYCAELPVALHLRNPNQLKQWLLSIAALDVGYLGKNIKLVATEIRHYASQWSLFDYNEFKAHCSWKHFGLFFSPVRDFMESYLQDPCAETLKVLLQWTCFLTRITLETGFSPSSDEFLVTEDRLKGLVCDNLWDELREVMMPIALRYKPDDFRPVFSQGANSDSPRGLGLWGKVKEGWYTTSNHRYLLHKVGWDVSRCPEEVSRDCKLVFVPKGIDSKRAICEEPAFSMFLQQGVLREIDKWFQRDPLIKRHICLHDQSIQRDRAQHASFTMDTATIDLSAASDSVSWKLVVHVLSGSSLLEDLRLTRTETVLLPEGQRIVLEKFAPMGSALCFPIECLIFLGICLLGCKRAGVYPTIGVYGDDLIIPVGAEEEIQHLLTHFGFQVNEKKSFWGYERFKESCGGEYFDGTDVSPLYIPRNFFVSRTDHRPSLLATYTDFCNSLFMRNFRWMRRYLLSVLLLPLFPGVLFSSTADGGLLSTHATNFHLRERWNPSLQRLEVRCQRIYDAGDVVSDDEARYLLLQLRYRDTRRSSLIYPDDQIDVRLVLPRLEVGWHWTPKEDSVNPDSVVAIDGSVTMLNYSK